MHLIKDDEIDIGRQSQPYFIYREYLAVTQERLYFLFPIDYGFSYLLRRLTVDYPLVLPAERPATPLTPEIRVEFFNSSRSTTRQNEPIPVNLYYSAADFRTVQSIIPNCFFGGIRGNHKILNYMYVYGDNINIQFTNLTPNINLTLRVLLEGYYIADSGTGYWRK